MSTVETKKSAAQSVKTSRLIHPYTSIAELEAAGPHVMESASGLRIRDKQGREYLDAMGGLWCVNVGYGRAEVVDAIARQAGKMSFYHSFMGLGNEPALALAERLAELTPSPLNRVFFGNSGSDANDTQVKLVWYYNNLRGKPKKKKIISRHGSYHGVTVAAASMTGLPAVHNCFDLPIDRFIHVGRPHYYWDGLPGMTEREFTDVLIKELEERIIEEGPETVAAFIAEPVIGGGGVIPPPEGYFDGVVRILRKYDILFIADEVITGFGRLGSWFGSTHYGFEPDMMTVAKGLTSGYVPMSAAIVSEEIWEVLRDAGPEVGVFSHGFTYSAHPLAAAAAMANLDVIENEGLVANAAEVGSYLQATLRDAFSGHPLVGDVRGLGLMAGIELVANKEEKTPFDASLQMARRLYTLTLEEGLICRPMGNVVALSPPLILTKADADEIVEKLGRGLGRLTDNLLREGFGTGA